MEKRMLVQYSAAVSGAFVAGGIAVGALLAAESYNSEAGELVFITSEIAQVMLSIAAVSFAIMAARAYGGEIGKAIYIASGGVIIFGAWQLLNAMTRLLALSEPPVRVGSTVNLVVTILLMAGFYMLYETISGHVEP